ncbi:MAG: ACP S-malonyltransferase [Pseudomonadota bacterium]
MGTAFVFPGEHHTQLKALAELTGDFAEIQATFREASRRLDSKLWDRFQNAWPDRPEEPQVALPLAVTCGIAVWRIWREIGGPLPEMMAGQGVGEISAMIAAGALELEDGAWLAAQQGNLLAQAQGPRGGAMAEFRGVDPERLQAMSTLAAEGDPLDIVIINGPLHVIVAGTHAAVTRMVAMAEAAHARYAERLPLPLASCGPLTEAAASSLTEVIRKLPFKAPQVPVLQAAGVEVHVDPEEMRRALIDRLTATLDWGALLTYLTQFGISRVVECGPGGMLSQVPPPADGGLEIMTLADTAGLHMTLMEMEA